MTSGGDLRRQLSRRIAREGPITFREFMSEALYHSSLGRYSSPRPPMGPQGDYITSPEVDEAFGRLIGRAVADMDAKITASRGRAAGTFTVVEMGPGSGSLCRDLLGGVRGEFPDLARRLEYVLVESSASLRTTQASNLEEAAVARRCRWRSWDDLAGEGPITGCIIANEFLDALPVHVVTWRGARLREVHVGIGEDGCLREEILEPSSVDLSRHLEDLGVRLEEGQRAEINLAALDWIRQAADRLEAGYVLIVDYGHEAEDLFSERHFAGTLLGYRRHRLVVDPLESPGEQDLTAHVDFTSLRREAIRSGFEVSPLTTQRNMLVSMGLANMIADLAKGDSAPGGAGRVGKRFALHALMSPAGMGTTFKASSAAAAGRC
jgi:SAM-dependent MidA family methyltransferase